MTHCGKGNAGRPCLTVVVVALALAAFEGDAAVEALAVLLPRPASANAGTRLAMAFPELEPAALGSWAFAAPATPPDVAFELAVATAAFTVAVAEGTEGLTRLCSTLRRNLLGLDVLYKLITFGMLLSATKVP